MDRLEVTGFEEPDSLFCVLSQIPRSIFYSLSCNKCDGDPDRISVTKAGSVFPVEGTKGEEKADVVGRLGRLAWLNEISPEFFSVQPAIEDRVIHSHRIE